MKKLIVFSLTAVLLVFALNCFAAESKYFSGESYLLKQGETVDGDLFVFSNSIVIEGTVTGEAFLFGSSIRVPGEIIGDVFVIGDSVDLSGHFVTDVRVLGNGVDLTGSFDGEVSAAGRRVDISAVVAGVVSAAGETVSAGGTFADTVNLHARKVLLLPEGRFDNDVNVSAEEFSKADSAVIAGKLNQVIGRELAREKKKEGIAGWWVVLVFWLVTLCGIIIVGLVMNRLFPDYTARTEKLLAAEPIASLGLGLLTLLLFPIALGILLITLVGIPLALLLLVCVFVCLYLGKLFAVVAVGGFIVSRLFKEEAAFWVRLVIGAVVVYLALAVPIAGFFLAVIVYCVGIGAIVNGFLRSRKQPAPTPAGDRPATTLTPRKAAG